MIGAGLVVAAIVVALTVLRGGAAEGAEEPEAVRADPAYGEAA